MQGEPSYPSEQTPCANILAQGTATAEPIPATQFPTCTPPCRSTPAVCYFQRCIMMAAFLVAAEKMGKLGKAPTPCLGPVPSALYSVSYLCCTSPYHASHACSSPELASWIKSGPTRGSQRVRDWPIPHDLPPSFLLSCSFPSLSLLSLSSSPKEPSITCKAHIHHGALEKKTAAHHYQLLLSRDAVWSLPRRPS